MGLHIGPSGRQRGAGTQSNTEVCLLSTCVCLQRPAVRELGKEEGRVDAKLRVAMFLLRRHTVPRV